jgi:c-di-GMP-binding flagellar brake protein YcgR
MLALWARPAVAQSLIEQIGWRGASWTAIGVILLAIGGGSVALLLVYLGKRRNQQRDYEALADRRFLDTAERFGLSQQQVHTARELLQFERTLEPQVILQSVSVFERCVDRAIQAMVSAKADDTERQTANDLISGIRQKAGFAQLPLEHPLASSRNVEIGQSGSLFGADHRNPLIQRATVVQSNEFYFTLQYDIEHEDAIHLAPGHEIKFTFARRNDGMYGVPVRVMRVDGRGNIDVGHTLSLRRNQLRQYVRIEASFSAKARLIRTDEPDSNQVKRGESVDAKLSDISGGGLSFLCERSFRAGDVITLSFSLPNARFAGVASKVLRISLQEGKTVTYFKHHVQFVDIDQRKRDQIVKYVFEKQRQISQWR